MGLRLSKVGSDPYYANYERTFEKLDAEHDRLKGQVIKIQKQLSTYQGWNLFIFGVFLSIAVAHAAWVKQHPSDDYTWREDAQRLATLVLLILAACAFHKVCSGYFHWAESRCQRRMKRLQDSKRKMIQDLKDSTRFEKTMTLIRKYDGDQQMQTPAATPIANIGPGTPYPGPGLHPGFNTPASSYRYPIAATAAAAAFSSTGKVLMPVFDKLANTLVGDNPALLNDFRRAQQQLQEAHRQAQTASSEAMVLRDQNVQLAKLVQELAGKCDEAMPEWVASMLQADEPQANAIEDEQHAEPVSSGTPLLSSSTPVSGSTPGKTPKGTGATFEKLLEAAAHEDTNSSDQEAVASQRSSASGMEPLLD